MARSNQYKKVSEKYKHTKETKKKIGKSNSVAMKGKKNRLGKPHSEKTKKLLSKLNKGKHSSPKTEFKKGKTYTKAERLARSKALKGSKSHLWRGGIYPKHKAIRKTVEYKLWREAVFEKDRYTCIWCGYRGKKLQADHIKPFAYYPELRFAIDNGRTLCENCHKTTDTFAGKLQKLNK